MTTSPMTRSSTQDFDRLLYRPPTTPVLVEVPRFDVLAVDGIGDPTGASFQQAVSVLYSLTYPVVMTLRRAGRAEVKVWPLEALWWAHDMVVFQPERADRDAWRWTAFLRLPDEVPDDVMAAARAKATVKLGPEVVGRAQATTLDEGLCAQVMHRGPYSEEGPTIAALHAFIAARGLRLRGHHHEIYLSDPRRCAPANMRTVLRQPVS